MSKQIDLRTLLENKLGSIDVQPLQSSRTAIENVGRQIPSNLYYEANSGEFTPETIASDYGTIRPLSIEEAKEFETKINDCIDQLFQEGVHYGTVTGVKKKFLFKAGAEVVANLLGLVVRTEIIDKVEDYANGYFLYTCKTWLIDGSGVVRAEGLGCCNSRENKYTSFKCGDFEGVKNGRFFTYLTEESFGEILKNVPELKVDKLWISADVRTERGKEQWLNVILRK